jgi:thymidylate kinase
MSKQHGLLVVFSGLDGAGKSTQIQILTDHLYETGQRTKYIWARGGYTPTLERLKGLARKTLKGGLPSSGHSVKRQQSFQKAYVRRLWLTVAMLDLIWLYGVKLRWQIWRGQAMICDRYLDDTLIDFRLNFPQEQIERWWLWRGLAHVTPTPDVTFWMWIPVEESVRRSAIKGEPFPDSPAVLTRRLSEYEALATLHGWQSLDGRRSIVDLAGEIQSTVDQVAQARQHSHGRARSSGLSG